ncbi:MAG: GNAT family N-acetyltransferase, partial [Candidatus Latescibacteria bacterium]|nr:GNAT family N-acetyltransferase [Candidatus Latescibacterota bacterium]
VVERTIMVGGIAHPAAGVGNVCARPRWRKKGVIDHVMAVALEEAEKRGFEAGFLFCKPLLETVYRRMGWTRLDVPVFFDNESGVAAPMPETNIAMVFPLGGELFPEGGVDLMGRDW